MITLYVLLGVVAILSIFVIMTYNGIVSLANQVKNSWANVLVQEQQKQKIVPRLLEAVKGYSDFESTLQKQITELRTMTDGLSKSSIEPEKLKDVETKTNEMLSSIKVSVENYPELKASDLYQKLMTEITEQQENVGASLRIFNSNVSIHNTTIQSFPSNIVNGMLNKRKEVSMFDNLEASQSVGFSPDNL